MTTAQEAMKILIVGAGIGGIAAALALIEAGFEVEVYERAGALAEVGAGIQISPNGVKILQSLGLGEALERVAFRPAAIEMRFGKSGAKLFDVPMREEAVRRYGAPYYHVYRPDLMKALGDALTQRAPHALYLGAEAVGFRQDANGVSVRFADGGHAAGDAVVGADGIHSVIRTEMFGAERPRFTGNAAWRVVVPAARLPKGLVPPTACVWVGPGRHAVTYYLRRGELVNFVGVVERSDWQGESWVEQGAKADLAADYAGWAKPIAAIIDAAGECYRWALFDRDPLPSWTHGRVALLGDACHPMLPFLAQGAVMAIEDAWVLSRRLKAQARDVAAALRTYEDVRKPRASRVQHAARAQMGLYHKRGVPAQLATYGPIWLAARAAPGFVHSRQDWLYGYDAVANG
jgi:salicylate hydroxylase